MKAYEKFIGNFMKELAKTLDFEPNRIFFMKSDTDASDDRVYVDMGLIDSKNKNFKSFVGLHIMELYLQYLDGVNLSEIIACTVEGMESIHSQNTRILPETAESLMEYEKARENLLIRPLNINEIKEGEDAVYKVIGDIALVAYYKVFQDNGVLFTLKVRRPYIKKWGKTEEEVLLEAMNQTAMNHEPRRYKWRLMVKNPYYNGEPFMNVQRNVSFDKSPLGNCISTEQKTNGAASIFYPKVADRVAELLGGDFWCAFVSKHEVMVHSCKSSDKEILKIILKETIAGATPPEDFLSYHIYKYDSAEKKFICQE